MKQLIKKCPECGDEFIPNQSNQKYCSPECRARHGRYHLRKTCVVCGKKFLGYYRAKYCSETCKNKVVFRCVCKVCGKVFFARNYNAVSCSRECCDKSNRKYTAFEDGMNMICGCKGRQDNRYPNLEAERLKRGLTRTAFSELLGITSATYSNRQSGRIKGTKNAYWEKYADILGVSVDYLKEEKPNA